METTTSYQLTADDIAWVSRKLNAHYVMIKKSEVLTEEEKQCEINYLMNRALRLGLRELVDRMGYLIFDIPFSEGREAQLILPKGYTKKDIEMIERAIIARFPGYEKYKDEIIQSKAGTMA